MEYLTKILRLFLISLYFEFLLLSIWNWIVIPQLRIDCKFILILFFFCFPVFCFLITHCFLDKLCLPVKLKHLLQRLPTWKRFPNWILFFIFFKLNTLLLCFVKTFSSYLQQLAFVYPLCDVLYLRFLLLSLALFLYPFNFYDTLFKFVSFLQSLLNSFVLFTFSFFFFGFRFTSFRVSEQSVRFRPPGDYIATPTPPQPPLASSALGSKF